jgi:uncharacterized protein YoxC
MSVIGDAFQAVKEAIKLTDDVKQVGEALKDVAHELRDHDRRITRLEAKWEAAIELSSRRPKPRRIEDKNT